MEIKELREKFNIILFERNIEENIEFIKEHIPEVEPMIGFEHNHPYHYLDVWGHTVQVVKNIEVNDLQVLVAAFFHDIGKPFSYQDGDEVRHFHGHPEVSVKITKEILKRLNYEEKFIEDVLYLIKTHDIDIDVDNLDNCYEMVKKKISLQYADIRAHSQFTVEKRISLLKEKEIYLKDKYETKEDTIDINTVIQKQREFLSLIAYKEDKSKKIFSKIKELFNKYILLKD